MKNLIKLSDLTKEDLVFLLELSKKFKLNPYSHLHSLQGDTIALYFTHPSTRTRISFQTAISRLGATSIVLGPNDLQLGRGETIMDTTRVFSQYCRATIIRTALDEDLEIFSKASRVPVINALSNTHHPCQALADLLTLQEYFGTLNGIKLAYIGDGNNVAHSLIEAAVLGNIELSLACPIGYEPSSDILNRAILNRAQDLPFKGKNPIKLFNSAEEAIQDADAVYTDTWLSMGQPEKERSQRLKDFSLFQVTHELMKQAKPDAVFMHCLPAHRGEEVVADVIDGSQSIVFKQSENRLYTAQAVLYALLNNLLKGQTML